ncbi:Uncharacterized protein BP5553_08004 [Venustampulla echinocandica]|uniref:Atos-like conserved domain-containing protein n=1 Tax=Venustampulla echinocandica TaxID=2656787 RepID=A0A370TFG6_9HELO|nr:Uncharacterized protein BP5553_08004 [Venustampulla echinocandica]RDL33636.1 Uncharacterized protein BP5553_08004 [Venustampulla echinocandica]
MPIFQDDHDLGAGQGVEPDKPAKCPRTSSPLNQIQIIRRLSEESIRTELCEGPLPDTPEDQATRPVGTLNADFEFPFHGHGTFDRGELIDRLKKGESPTWLPNRNLESLLKDCHSTPKKTTPDDSTGSPPLLPSPQIFESQRTAAVDIEQSEAGLQIERPRSALHSGDFTEGPQESIQRAHNDDYGLFGSQKSAWLASSPPRNFLPFQLDPRFPPVDRLDAEFEARSRIPSLSSSYSSSFVLKPPTSPLVQSESNDDLDLSSSINPIDIEPHQKRNSRRHTLQASHSIHSTPNVATASSFRPLPHLRRDNTHPYQAHQPRRSLTSNPSPQTPSFLRSRRPSYQSENSPLNHASMVGSYEESILRGRMSTTPSKPLDFMAQIGVLGLGKCKMSLRCPAHVMIPFPAVFYSYETTTHGRSAKSEDGPSPYVGQIDLENSLPNPDETRDSKRKQRNANIGRSRIDNLEAADGHSTSQPSDREIRRAEKQKRRSASPRAPPGGSYRIPEKGQLQVIIKNPNKTAVKLFLVPYDLTGMEPGTKTFIRQRSYSTGPIIDSALSSSQQTPATNSVERPTLRYLIHLHICSPSRGRFYLYKSIRVVFANRVPDGKEKLRNEISMPDPRFSVYKPVRDSTLGHSIMSGAGANLAAEKAYRRRSSGFALGPSNRAYDGMEGITQALEKGFNNGPAFSPGQENGSAVPIEPIPFSLFRKPIRSEDDSGQERPSNIQSSDSNKSSISPTSIGLGNSMSWNSNSTGIGGYDKLNKGDVGYGGNPFAGSPDGRQVVAEGLLAKKLRDLGVGVPGPQEGMDGI